MSLAHRGTGILDDMYRDYFLDYASYVILERAVPAIEDGLKPVQRRLLHAMFEMHDGRYHKVANIIGQTMQFHPHGDAAIRDALVNLGQKELIIDTQGNWGDYRTGDAAAAPRYIEARLNKFILETGFNKRTTKWQVSYDGRKDEPVTLPMKFPLLLALGVEGIAVGLSTKILPHNFIELIKGSIKILQGKRVKLYPDFLTGGIIDVSEYNHGRRGAKLKIRARMEKRDKSAIAITELPYGVTTSSLIDSIVKAADKGKIKIKKVVDNTAKDVEILISLGSGISPERTMDALYAFTNCQVSVSPNACVIVDKKPQFMGVEEILEYNTLQTKDLLGKELEIKLGDLREKWQNASLAKIFIENRVYHEIEECESWEEVLQTIRSEMKKYVREPGESAPASDRRVLLLRPMNEEDIIRLTEIKIKRISKYNTFKETEYILQLEKDIEQVLYDLDHLTEFTISYYENLLEKYGKGRERRTEISSFENIQLTNVVAENAKLYVNRKEGFVGTALKKEEFVRECSDIADIIAFRKDGKYSVARIGEKLFMGKNIIHVDVWKKGDKRSTYNVLYLDGKTGKTMAKRFHVDAITRERVYDITKGNTHSKLLYFSANPNGEAEKVSIVLSPNCKARNKVLEFDFGSIEIKGRGAGGNTVTKYPVRKVSLLEKGKSTLGAIKLWMDEHSGRIHKEERGRFVGDFDTGDLILALYKDGSYELKEANLPMKYDPNQLFWIGKFVPYRPVNCIYFEPGKTWTMIKRFLIETKSLDQKFSFLPDTKGVKCYLLTGDDPVTIRFSFKRHNQKIEKTVRPDELMDVKGWKALGNRLHDGKLLSAKVIEKPSTTAPSAQKPIEEKASTKTSSAAGTAKQKTPSSPGKQKNAEQYKPGDVIEFDENGQGKLF